jgi:hemoglobin
MTSIDDGLETSAPPTADILDRTDVSSLVRAFYRDAATDTLLGPVFEAAEVDWPAHIHTLTDFWAWQLLGERGYEGNPLRAHEPIHQQMPFSPAHFARWLDLFTATVDASFAGPVADTAKQRAVKMANALQRLLRGDDRSDETGQGTLVIRPAAEKGTFGPARGAPGQGR